VKAVLLGGAGEKVAKAFSNKTTNHGIPHQRSSGKSQKRKEALPLRGRGDLETKSQSGKKHGPVVSSGLLKAGCGHAKRSRQWAKEKGATTMKKEGYPWTGIKEEKGRLGGADFRKRGWGEP